MTWREMPEEDRAYVIQTLGQMIHRRQEDIDWLTRVNPASPHIALYQRMIDGHESAIAALEELARGPETPPSR